MRNIIENGIKLINFMDASNFPSAAFGLRQTRFYLGDEGDPNVPLVLVTHFPPNGVLPRHYHADVFVDAVVQGTSIIDGEECHAGTLRWFPAKATYGPVIAGPEGCVFLEFYTSEAGLQTTLEWSTMADDLKADLTSRGIHPPAETQG
jgi:hypothetical protein